MSIQVNDFQWEPGKNDAEYIKLLESSRDAWQKIAQKAIAKLKALSKAQEPRVMTLEEVLDMKFDDVVYLQVYPTNAVLSAIVIDVIPKLSEINVGVVQFRHGAGYNGINNADLSYYGKTWRCWTSRPTDEQREAVKWE